MARRTEASTAARHAVLFALSGALVSCAGRVIVPVIEQGPPSDSDHGAAIATARPSIEAPLSAVPTSTELASSTEDEEARAARAALEARMTFRGDMPASIGKDDPAFVHANASSEGCRKEVERRKLSVTRVKSAAKGIADTFRLAGPMNGVKLVTPEGKHGLLDCRLVLAIDELTKVLAEFSVKELRVDNFYRPGAKLPGQKKASQHAHGLAIDLTTMTLTDGRTLSTSDWGAAIGDKPCGPDAVMAEPTAARVDVRNLVCELGRRKIFHTILTPSFNQAHQSHFHLDIKRESTYASVR